MIEYSLKDINSKSPYPVTVTDKGDFVFLTDNGIHYSVAFELDRMIGECDTYQFILRKIDDSHSAKDTKVSITVLEIIFEFFRKNLNVLLYLCDTSDHREEARNRLFLHWFEKYAEKDKFIIKSAETEIEGEGFYVAIIVDKRNPKIDAITAEFDEESEYLTNKPDD